MTTTGRNQTTGTQVGVIADTHGLLRPEAIAALQTSDLILHAGDIGKPEVLSELQAIAPVIAVRGNNDNGDWAATLPEQKTVPVEGITILLLHIVQQLDLDLTATGVRIVISGHSHKPLIEERNGILFLNPGSAGPRRFKLPITVAHLHIKGDQVQAEMVNLNL